MQELTLESLARRVEALERLLKLKAQGWRAAIGMFAGSEFSREVDEAGFAIREADREEARREADRQ